MARATPYKRNGWPWSTACSRTADKCVAVVEAATHHVHYTRRMPHGCHSHARQCEPASDSWKVLQASDCSRQGAVTNGCRPATVCVSCVLTCVLVGPAEALLAHVLHCCRAAWLPPMLCSGNTRGLGSVCKCFVELLHQHIVLQHTLSQGGRELPALLAVPLPLLGCGCKHITQTMHTSSECRC